MTDAEIHASAPEVVVAEGQSQHMHVHQQFLCNGVVADVHLTWHDHNKTVTGHVTWGRHVTEL